MLFVEPCMCVKFMSRVRLCFSLMFFLKMIITTQCACNDPEKGPPDLLVIFDGEKTIKIQNTTLYQIFWENV